MALGKKQLINVSEQHKAWITDVVGAAQAQKLDINQTDIIRALFDEASKQRPSDFIEVFLKIKRAAELEAIEREEATLKARKEKLLDEANTMGQLMAAR